MPDPQPAAHAAPSTPQVTDHIDTILAAALAEFAEAGYGGVTLDDVARRASVPRAALAATFATKDDLFREVVRTTLLGEHGTFAPILERALVVDATTAEAVDAFARRYWHAMEHPPLATLLRLTSAELPRFPELAVFHATETLERFLHEIERLIARGIARGEVGAVEPRAVARTMLAALATYALWFSHPAVYAGLVGASRERAEAGAIESLLRMLPPAS